MHISDGYLCPQMHVSLYVISGTFWSIALKKLKKSCLHGSYRMWQWAVHSLFLMLFLFKKAQRKYKEIFYVP